MGKKKHKRQIQTGSLPNQQIIPSKLDATEVRFSFKYLDAGNSKFQFSTKEAAYFVTLIERMKEVSKLTPKQMWTTHKDSLRCHTHTWARTSEPKGFALKGDISDSEGWQFQLSSNAHGRVHGFFVGTTFFVVWLDPDHALYP